MEINELRIGNLLQDAKGRICKVTELTEDRFIAPSIMGALTTHPHEPIKLTKDWLLRFQFTNAKNSSNFVHGDFLLYGTTVGGFWFDKNNMLFNYVHELQNFYFTLYKKELQYK